MPIKKSRKTRIICAAPRFRRFCATDSNSREIVHLTFDEYEAIRLHDYEHMEQEQVSQQMQISRPTISATLASAHEKIADVIVNGKLLMLDHSDCEVCSLGANCPKAKQDECAHRHRCASTCRKKCMS